MGENQERRQAHRQKRGLFHAEEILAAAGTPTSQQPLPGQKPAQPSWPENPF